MLYFLFCHINGCDFRIAYSPNISGSAIDKLEKQFKDHLKTHPIDDIIDQLYGFILMSNEESWIPAYDRLKAIRDIALGFEDLLTAHQNKVKVTPR